MDRAPGLPGAGSVQRVRQHCGPGLVPDAVQPAIVGGNCYGREPAVQLPDIEQAALPVEDVKPVAEMRSGLAPSPT